MSGDGEALVRGRWRPGRQGFADLPFMTPGIDDAADKPAMLLINGGLLGGAGRDRPGLQRYGIVGDKEDSTG